MVGLKVEDLPKSTANSQLGDDPIILNTMSCQEHGGNQVT